MTRTRILVLMTLSACLGTGCGKTFCDVQGYTLYIEDPPWSVVHYGFHVEFEDASIELDCEVDDGKPSVCETSLGPWRVEVQLTLSDNADFSGIIISIENGDEFTSVVPDGTIRVVVTDVADPLFEAEFISEPEVHRWREGRRVCESADDVWMF